MSDIKKFIEKNSVDKGFLQDWYQHSVTDEPPVWTDEHIAEVYGDFYLIPKETVEKLETSKDVILDIDNNLMYCPHCKEMIGSACDWTPNYCCECGKALSGGNGKGR